MNATKDKAAIAILNRFHQAERVQIKALCQLLAEDPDGAWAMLDDYGFGLDYDEVEIICEAMA